MGERGGTKIGGEGVGTKRVEGFGTGETNDQEVEDEDVRCGVDI